jgi:hypothetical protein
MERKREIPRFAVIGGFDPIPHRRKIRNHCQRPPAFAHAFM